MTRSAIVTMLVGFMLAALAGPALGQPYPPPPRVNVTTPGATITITGDNYGPGTTVTVTTNNTSQSATQSSVRTMQVTVADDGTFEAPVTVPEDAAGEYVVEIAGTDAAGVEKAETQVFAVSANVGGAETAADEGGLTPLHLLFGGMLVAAAGLLIRRRVRA